MRRTQISPSCMTSSLRSSTRLMFRFRSCFARFSSSTVSAPGFRIWPRVCLIVSLASSRSHQTSLTLGLPCTRHRVFLATLIVAAKYLNDSSPKNKHWAIYANLFDINEINLMEKQLLFLLDYELRFDEEEALAAFEPFLPTSQAAANSASTRAKAVIKVTEASKARAQAQLPPTPPSEERPRNTVPYTAAVAAAAAATTTTAAQTIATTVNSLARRLSRSYLGGAPPVTPTPVRDSLGSRTISNASTASGADSEASMGSLTEDNSTTDESSDELHDLSDDDMVSDDESAAPAQPNTLLRLQAVHARRHARKASDTATIAAHDSNSTLHMLGSDSAIPSSVTLDQLSLSTAIKPLSFPAQPVLHNKRSLRLRRPTAPPRFDTPPKNAHRDAHATPPAGMTASATSNFLTRMWGAATRSASMTEVDVAATGRTRLPHSRSGMLRADLDA